MDESHAEETPLKLALKVLKAINKSVKSAVQITTIPDELCIGETVDLSKWSMITTDDNLLTISKQPESHYFVDPSKPFVSQMWHRFWEETQLPYKLRTLNLSKSVEISDYALTCVLRGNPHLTDLNISGCSNISDVSLRELGLNNLNLQALNISSCDGVEGQGLISVAECCKQLRRVDFSSNTTLQRFAISKIFYECHKLEYVELNNVRQVGDDEIRALAQNSPNLVSLIAREAVFLSDQSLLAMSQFCPDLDTVDLRREQGTFRITDVGLLALGERSKALRYLNLNGCEQVSDVGVQWLADGCRSLEELHLSDCPRVTDAGLRFLGEHCRALKILDVCNAQYCTDVGLANLSFGCPNLKVLRAKGMWLLSDPRLTEVKKKGDKKKAEAKAWETVVGVPALVHNSQKLEEIDLTGCFRLNSAVKTHLSTLSELRIVTLTRCNQMESRSLQALARGCHKLEEINFNDVGKCVDSDAMKQFAICCKYLRRVSLNRNPSITGNCVKWIARIESLERLELSQCKDLTDVDILPLTEPDKCPHLSMLSLTKNEGITDTALAWVSNGCADQLLTFSFKGSSITKASSRAVRDMFAYCDMIFDDKVSGFFPKPRVGHRKLLNHYYIMQQGFARIQARVRRWGATRRVAWKRGEAKRQRSAQIITNSLRIRGAVIAVHKVRKAWWKLNRDAEILTSFWWLCMAKKRVWRIKKALYEQWVREQVECIQRAWRLFWKKTRWFLLKKEFLEWVRLNVHSATKIQSVVRMFQGVARARRIFHMKEGRKVVEERKARILQRVYRGYRGRIRAWLVRSALEDRLFQMNRGASSIQRSLRAHRMQRFIAARIQVKRATRGAVVMMQRIVRGRLSRIRVMEIKADIREIAEERGALKIQTRWRVKKAVLRVARVREAYLKRLKKQDSAATKIANAHRGRMARRQFREAQEMKSQNAFLKVQARIWAATTIESYWRGFCGRRRFNNLIREKKGKWKELFDQEKQRRFFYNKLTGEIRWRMPQDLLDLVPRPQCDNCEYFEAALECVVCNEVYCMQCFDQVHYGGRRRDHEFRSLYDFYGKRLDYGDGVFPSKWPSEVIQDEVQGWMLRVAPIRDPIQCWGSWEVYSDADARTVPAEGAASRSTMVPEPPLPVERTFFFNRTTFEATYDEPAEVQQLKTEHEASLQEQARQAEKDSQRVAEMASYVSAQPTPSQQQQQQQLGYDYDYGGDHQEGTAYVDPSSQGYYAEDGQWISADVHGGYYDDQGQWIVTADIQEGWQGQDHEYAEGEWEGYYDEEGNYIYTDPNVNGYWDYHGQWVEYTSQMEAQKTQRTARSNATVSARGPQPPLSSRMIASARGSRSSARGTGRSSGSVGIAPPGAPMMATSGSMRGAGGVKASARSKDQGWMSSRKSAR